MRGEQGGDGLQLLRADRCTVTFDGLSAMRDVSLEVRRSQICSLIGPNGAGKTTFINALSGFQQVSDGRIYADDRNVTGLPPRRMARLGISRSFQGLRLFPRFSVRENVQLGAIGVGHRPRDAEKDSLELLTRAGLLDWADRRASELPQGIERRVGVLRALASRPSFLLLDEPAAGLNDEETADLCEYLVSVRDEFGCGILLVEHDMSVVFAISDYVYVLDYGELLSQGRPRDVASDEAVRAAYFGPAPIGKI